MCKSQTTKFCIVVSNIFRIVIAVFDRVKKRARNRH
jgi:hypothetical protein